MRMNINWFCLFQIFSIFSNFSSSSGMEAEFAIKIWIEINIFFFILHFQGWLTKKWILPFSVPLNTHVFIKNQIAILF